MAAGQYNKNSLLKDFLFPPYDEIQPKRISPAILSLLDQLKIKDRLSVVWGIVNHLNAVMDSPELCSVIEEVQPEKVKFQLRLDQSKPIYNAFKAIRQSSEWESLSEARKRIVEAQIKEAVLNGVSLEDDKKLRLHEVQQELEKLARQFEENILDATNKLFEKLITDKKDLEGMTATGLAAQLAVSKKKIKRKEETRRVERNDRKIIRKMCWKTKSDL